MSPWNYPFLLTIEPLVDALATGNTAVVKPSAYSPYTSALIQELLEECFDPAYVAVVTGGRKENSPLTIFSLQAVRLLEKKSCAMQQSI